MCTSLPLAARSNGDKRLKETLPNGSLMSEGRMVRGLFFGENKKKTLTLSVNTEVCVCDLNGKAFGFAVN